MKFNTNSNVYIIIYSVVMVVIVAVLLSLAALGLKPRQDENILNEKKTQIVKALGYDAATTAYGDVVAEALLLNADGAVVENDTQKVFDALQSVKDTRDAGLFPIFKATDGSVVVPLYGAGLWGPIWGYIALAPDMNTVKGIVLDHSGETPGLGAEIASDAHQAQYVGKQIFVDGELTGIIVKKGGATVGSVNEVDAISGGTKTCDGVTDMFKNSLANYVGYLKPAAAPINVEEPVELIPVAEEVKVEAVEVSNDKIEQSNE